MPQVAYKIQVSCTRNRRFIFISKYLVFYQLKTIFAVWPMHLSNFLPLMRLHHLPVPRFVNVSLTDLTFLCSGYASGQETQRTCCSFTLSFGLDRAVAEHATALFVLCTLLCCVCMSRSLRRLHCDTCGRWVGYPDDKCIGHTANIVFN